ncbi:MAG: hypothetical protein GY757_07365 [bacterium]|nr:hypothetical protein [bacterium]
MNVHNLTETWAEISDGTKTVLLQKRSVAAVRIHLEDSMPDPDEDAYFLLYGDNVIFGYGGKDNLYARADDGAAKIVTAET